MDGSRTFYLRVNNLNSNSNLVVYKLYCKTCGKQYIGSTKTQFRLRFNNYKSQFRSYIKQKRQDIIFPRLVYSNIYLNLSNMA